MSLYAAQEDFPALIVIQNIQAGLYISPVLYVIVKPAFLQFHRQAKGIVYLVNIHERDDIVKSHISKILDNFTKVGLIAKAHDYQTGCSIIRGSLIIERRKSRYPLESVAFFEFAIQHHGRNVAVPPHDNFFEIMKRLPRAIDNDLAIPERQVNIEGILGKISVFEKAP